MLRSNVGAQFLQGEGNMRVLVSFLLCLSVTFAGCATKAPTPYLLSSAGIGVAVISPLASEIGVVESNLVDASGSAAEAMKKISLGPLGLFVAPFALGGDVAECDRKLLKAYPGLRERAPAIVQREFFPSDVQDQFVAVLQESTSIPIAHSEIVSGRDRAAGVDQLLSAAAQHSLAHLFVVEVANVSVRPFGKGCDSWKVWPKMSVELWRVGDRNLVLAFSFGYPQPFVAAPLSEMKSVFDEPGALRTRLRSTYEDAARTFSNRAMFQWSP